MQLPKLSLKNPPQHTPVIAALILVGFTFVLLLILFVLYLIMPKSKPTIGTPDITTTETIPSAVAEFVLDGPWRVGLEKEIAIDLAYTPKAPLVTALSIAYDPNFLKYGNVSISNFWTDTNIIEQTIDEAAGVINLQLIQDPEAEITGDPTMVVLSFTASNVGDTTLSLNPKSHVASAGIDQLIPLQAEALAITIRP